MTKAAWLATIARLLPGLASAAPPWTTMAGLASRAPLPVGDLPADPVGLGLAGAGDLDRDGRLDVVTRATGGAGSTTRVGLSGSAARGRLVGKAACFERLS